jgi:hypothetical protein
MPCASPVILFRITFQFIFDYRFAILPLAPLAWELDAGLITHHRKRQLVMKCYTGPWNWTEGPVPGSCEHGNEPSGSIKGFLKRTLLHGFS